MYPVFTPKDRRKLTAKLLMVGLTKEQAEDVVNQSEWVGINHQRLSIGHSMTIAENGVGLPFFHYCKILWHLRGRKEYHEQRQAVLN